MTCVSCFKKSELWSKMVRFSVSCVYFIFFKDFCLYLILQLERETRKGEENRDDMQQRPLGWNETQAAALRTQPSYTLPGELSGHAISCFYSSN